MEETKITEKSQRKTKVNRNGTQQTKRWTTKKKGRTDKGEIGPRKMERITIIKTIEINDQGFS